jgi:hypothetical protein
MNLQNLLTTFLDKQNLEILSLTNTLQHEQLTQQQWEGAQINFQNIISSLSSCVEQTCMTQPTPPVPNRAKIQGDFSQGSNKKYGNHTSKHTIASAKESMQPATTTTHNYTTTPT